MSDTLMNGSGVDGTDAPVGKGSSKSIREKLMAKYANKSNEELVQMNIDAQSQIGKLSSEKQKLLNGGVEVPNGDDKEQQQQDNSNDDNKNSGTISEDFKIIPESERQNKNQADDVIDSGTDRFEKPYKELLIKSVINDVMGGIENYKEVMSNHVSKMSDDEVTVINNLISKGDSELLGTVLKGIKAQYELENGSISKPSLIKGDLRNINSGVITESEYYERLLKNKPKTAKEAQELLELKRKSSKFWK